MKAPLADWLTTRIVVPVLGTSTPAQPLLPIFASGATQ